MASIHRSNQWKTMVSASAPIAARACCQGAASTPGIASAQATKARQETQAFRHGELRGLRRSGQLRQHLQELGEPAPNGCGRGHDQHLRRVRAHHRRKAIPLVVKRLEGGRLLRSLDEVREPGPDRVQRVHAVQEHNSQ